MAVYTDLLQALNAERLRSVFSTEGTLISASAAPRCGVLRSSSVEAGQGESEKPEVDMEFGRQ